MSISYSVVTVETAYQLPSTIHTLSFIISILSIKRLKDKNLKILIGYKLYVFTCVLIYTGLWYACDKGVCALLSSYRIQLTFILTLHLGDPCTFPAPPPPQVSISCSGVLILTQNCSLAAGLFLRVRGGWGGSWIPIAESPSQLLALECVRTVKVVYSILGP